MSVYRVTEIIGTSGTSWEDAAAEAIRTAATTIRDLRVAEVVKQDIHLTKTGPSRTHQAPALLQVRKRAVSPNPSDGPPRVCRDPAESRACELG